MVSEQLEVHKQKLYVTPYRSPMSYRIINLRLITDINVKCEGAHLLGENRGNLHGLRLAKVPRGDTRCTVHKRKK